MWVTCYADASFAGRGSAAWAVWLRSGAGRLVRSGRCPAYVDNSHQAELSAIYAAAYLALRAWGARVRGILVCSDCQSALEAARPDAPLSRDRATRRLQTILRELVAGAGTELELRWVKGHAPAKSGARAYLNHACDRMARKERRRAAPPRRRRRR